VPNSLAESKLDCLVYSQATWSCSGTKSAIQSWEARGDARRGLAEVARALDASRSTPLEKPVYVGVRERERERERDRQRERMFVGVREKERVCVCVCEREREREGVAVVARALDASRSTPLEKPVCE